MIDRLVEEVREAGQAYIAAFKGDRQALLDDLRRRQQKEDCRVVRLVSKPPRPRTSEPG
ncbi:MAG: hypothetical protein GX616_18165 [Planctomycetes bacterium]|nr:hypothetical protein [Planctomycetota bacterium]